MFSLRDCITRCQRDLTPDTSDLMALHVLPCAAALSNPSLDVLPEYIQGFLGTSLVTCKMHNQYEANILNNLTTLHNLLCMIN